MIVNAVIEMPSGTSYKYEFDKNTSELVLDRVLSISVPYNYGYVPNTLSEDGDPLDIFVLSSPIYPGARCSVEVVGVLKCTDGGVEDDKLVGILAGMPYTEAVLQSASADISHYLQNYKEGFEVLSYGSKEDAVDCYLNSLSRASRSTDK